MILVGISNCPPLVTINRIHEATEMELFLQISHYVVEFSSITAREKISKALQDKRVPEAMTQGECHANVPGQQCNEIVVCIFNGHAQ